MEHIAPLTDKQIIDALERKLGHLAARWRSTQNTQAEAEIIRQYQSILHCMIELGFHDSLDVDAELPDEFMPAEYLALFG